MAVQFDYGDKAGLMLIINTIKSKIDEYLENYVMKQEGKDLSSNDFSNDLKTKLDGIESGATKTIVDTLLSNSSSNPVENKVINAALENKAPVANPEFTGVPQVPTPLEGNNSLQIANTAFVQNAINSALQGITGLDFEVVSVLPTTGEKGIIYLLEKPTEENQNLYDEYVYVNGKWELIGTTAIDLSNYVQQDDLVAISSQEIAAMFSNW